MTTDLYFPAHFLYDKALTLRERWVLIHLYDAQQGKKSSQQTQLAIAQGVRFSVNTVRKSLKKLERLGYIVTQKIGADTHYIVVAE
jgi:predicted transcriptional regulator